MPKMRDASAFRVGRRSSVCGELGDGAAGEELGVVYGPRVRECTSVGK